MGELAFPRGNGFGCAEHETDLFDFDGALAGGVLRVGRWPARCGCPLGDLQGIDTPEPQLPELSPHF